MKGILGAIGSNASVVQAQLSAGHRVLARDRTKWVGDDSRWAVGVCTCEGGKDDTAALTWNEDETVCSVLVGELFRTAPPNEASRRKGHHARGPTQSQLLLHLWEAYGVELIRKVSGLFAAAIWETEPRRLTLLLDWIGGIHHLYCALVDDGIIFASEIRSLLATRAWGGRINQRALQQYLGFGHILPPETLFDGIHKLPPGCALTYEDGQVDVQRVFKLHFQPESANDWVERFQETFRQAIAHRVGGPDEVGAFLSGGLDSSFNVALMSDVQDSPVKTFSIAYPQEEFDESPYARLVARRFETDHHELTLASPEVLDELPEMIWALEEPAMDYSFIPTFNLARFAKEHVDVVISGDGPDHLLGRHYPVAFARRALGRIPGVSMLARALLADDRSAGWKVALWRRLRRSGQGRSLWKVVQSVAGSPAEAYLAIYREIAYRGLLPDSLRAVVPDSMGENLLNGPDIDAAISDNIDGDASEFERILALDLAIDGSFGVFAKVGKMATHHSLSVREPYLDLNVCALLSKVPLGLKVRGSTLDYLRKRARTKHLLYEAAKGLVPDEVMRKPKQGFQAPIGVWLREWIGQRDSRGLFPALTREMGLLNEESVDRVLGEHQRGRCDHGTLIMMLITLDLWYGIFARGNGKKPSWTWTDWLDQ